MSTMSASSLSGSQEHWQHSSTMADSYPNALTLTSALPQPRQEPEPTSLASPTDATETSKPSGVDWRTHGTSIQSKPKGQQIQISKFVNEKVPTKLFLSTFDNSVDSQCFACGSFNKDCVHVLRCTSTLQTKPALRLFMTFETTLPDTTHPSQWQIC